MGGCVPCSAGTYSSLKGASACLNCSTGTYQDNSGASSCSACAEGKFSSFTGANSSRFCLTDYTSCMPGTIHVDTGEVSVCVDCPAGSYCSTSDAILCDPGTYSGAAATSCSGCSNGHYQPAAGATSCLICPPGYYCPAPLNFKLVAGSGCFVNEIRATSNNYPLDYDNRQSCTINVLVFGTISVAAFDTEHGFDVLTVDGKNFSGMSYLGYSVQLLIPFGLNGLPVTPSTVITWSSGKYLRTSGWSIQLSNTSIDSRAATPCAAVSSERAIHISNCADESPIPRELFLPQLEHRMRQVAGYVRTASFRNQEHRPASFAKSI